MDKKELILDAALKLFVEHGFHGTATSKIAGEAGVANGTLFQYFATKEELIVALYTKVKEELADQIQLNLQKGTDIKESLKHQVLSSVYWALDNPLKFQFIQQVNTSPYIKKIDQDVVATQNEAHLTTINKAIKQGIFKPLPAGLIYSILSSSVFGLFHFLSQSKMAKNKQASIVNEVVENLFKSLA